MTQKTLTIGLIGYQFMGKAHSNAYRQVGRFFDLPCKVRMKTLCGRNEAAVTAMAEKYGWEGVATDYRHVLADPEIDIVDVATPGSSHCEIATAALEAGKSLFCEKPIANTLDEAEIMIEAARKANAFTAVFHNYRFAPAVALAKRMIDEGKIGRIFHIRATYLQDWIVDPDFPLVWRLQKDVAGSGSHGDLAAHLIDTARYLVGEFSSVVGHFETFVKDRPLVGQIDDKLGATASTERGEVTVDDASLFLARFQNGAVGTFEATRFATGRKNANGFEINGENGAIAWNMERMNELEFYNRKGEEGYQGFATIQATDASHPYASHYWPVAHIIGYEQTFINLLSEALSARAEGREFRPNLEDGYQNQRVLDAVARSADSKQWANL